MNFRLKLSEKGYEQRSDHEFGWYTEGEMDRKVALWRPTGLRRKGARDFSDSFFTAFSEVRGNKKLGKVR